MGRRPLESGQLRPDLDPEAGGHGAAHDHSADSRFWGFVPEDHIVGKASFVWLSLDANKRFPANIRWERIFKKVR